MVVPSWTGQVVGPHYLTRILSSLSAIHSNKLYVEVEWEQQLQPRHPLRLKTVEKLKQKYQHEITFILASVTLLV